MEPKPDRAGGGGGGIGELMAVKKVVDKEAKNEQNAEGEENEEQRDPEAEEEEEEEEEDEVVLLLEKEQVPKPYVLRGLQERDFHKGYLELLEQLTKVGDVSEESFRRRVRELQRLKDYHRTVVIEDVDKRVVVATGTLLIEPKIARSCGKAGHIEDVVVDGSSRGRHLGQKVVGSLVKIAKEVGCYKVILDCRKENAPFYEKCGFSEKEVQMAQYF